MVERTRRPARPRTMEGHTTMSRHYRRWQRDRRDVRMWVQHSDLQLDQIDRQLAADVQQPAPFWNGSRSALRRLRQYRKDTQR